MPPTQCDLRSSFVLSGPCVCRARFDLWTLGPWTVTGQNGRGCRQTFWEVTPDSLGGEASCGHQILRVWCPLLLRNSRLVSPCLAHSPRPGILSEALTSICFSLSAGNFLPTVVASMNLSSSRAGNTSFGRLEAPDL